MMISSKSNIKKLIKMAFEQGADIKDFHVHYTNAYINILQI